MGKAYGVIKTNESLSTYDPLVTFLTGKEVMFAAALFELVVISLLVSPRIEIKSKLATLCWISMLFLSYRVGLWSVGWRGGCGCFGPWNTSLWRWVPGAILGYLLFGSAVLLAFNWNAAEKQCASVSARSPNDN